MLVITSCEDNTAPAAVDAEPPLASWTIIQDFGVWNDFFQGYHLAEDAVAEPGEPVLAMADGVVKDIHISSAEPGYGAVMMIEHRFQDQSVVSLYGHISARRGFNVRLGDEVSTGDVVAWIADDDEDGGPWGPHLHFGIRRGPYSTDMVCDTWLYVGYTRDCAEMTHQEYLAVWFDPTDFFQAH